MNFSNSMSHEPAEQAGGDPLTYPHLQDYSQDQSGWDPVARFHLPGRGNYFVVN